MPRRKPTPAPRKTRHGATQPEDEREAKQVKLRLLPGVTARLDAIAAARGQTRSETVAARAR